MKIVSEVIGASCANLSERLQEWPQQPVGRPPLQDVELEIKADRRVHAILKSRALPWAANHKRVCRVMKVRELLLNRHAGVERWHDERIEVDERNRRWCSGQIHEQHETGQRNPEHRGGTGSKTGNTGAAPPGNSGNSTNTSSKSGAGGVTGTIIQRGAGLEGGGNEGTTGGKPYARQFGLRHHATRASTYATRRTFNTNNQSSSFSNRLTKSSHAIRPTLNTSNQRINASNNVNVRVSNVTVRSSNVELLP